jgi:hypothetical protein
MVLVFCRLYAVRCRNWLYNAAHPWSTLTSVAFLRAAEDEILFVRPGPVCLAVIWGLLSSVGIIEVKLRNEFLGTPRRGIIEKILALILVPPLLWLQFPKASLSHLYQTMP